MQIEHSALSHASTWGGNKPREMKRSQGGEKGWYPFDDKRVSPNKMNPIRPRYFQKLWTGQPPLEGEACHGGRCNVHGHPPGPSGCLGRAEL